MVTITTLRTPRLVVRPYGVGDRAHVVGIQSRADVTRYLPFGPRDEAEAAAQWERKMRQGARFADEGDALELAVTLPDGTYVGEVLLFYRSRAHRGAELGYMFLPEHGGRGYATEAAGALLDVAFGEAGIHRVYARMYGENTPSARVLERLGMRREAHLVANELHRGEWSDEVIYAILDEEWAAKRP